MTAPAHGPVRTLIVEDEPVARERLRRHLDAHDDFALVGEAESAERAVALCLEHRPELLLLDVRLPDGTGFDVLERVGREALPLVVFVTAFDDRAVLAFEANAVDYLLKPFTGERFAEALARVRRARASEESLAWAERLASVLGSDPSAQDASGGAGAKWLERLVVRDRDRYRLVPVEQVEWIRAARNYVEIRADGRTHLDRRTLSQLEAGLDPGRFARIHRSVIVARRCVLEVRSCGGDTFEVTLLDGEVLPMSRSYSGTLLERER